MLQKQQKTEQKTCFISKLLTYLDKIHNSEHIPPKAGAEVAVVAAAPNAGVAGLLPKLKPMHNTYSNSMTTHGISQKLTG